MDPRVEKIMTAAEYIAAKLDGRKPFAGIVLGSGLGKLADKLRFFFANSSSRILAISKSERLALYIAGVSTPSLIAKPNSNI